MKKFVCLFCTRRGEMFSLSQTEGGNRGVGNILLLLFVFQLLSKRRASQDEIKHREKKKRTKGKETENIQEARSREERDRKRGRKCGTKAGKRKRGKHVGGRASDKNARAIARGVQKRQACAEAICMVWYQITSLRPRC